VRYRRDFRARGPLAASSSNFVANSATVPAPVGPTMSVCPTSPTFRLGRNGVDRPLTSGTTKPKETGFGQGVVNLSMTFKDKYMDFQRLVWELNRLRSHNVSFDADSLELFFLAEGALVLLALERFMRMILGVEASDSDTLPNLLEKATSARLDLVVLPGNLDRSELIRRIKSVRNTLMHGNFEQAAKQAGLSSKEEYFRSGTYITEVEVLFKILNRIVAQIDPGTGRPHPRNHPDMQAYLNSEDFLDLRKHRADEKAIPARLTVAGASAPADDPASSSVSK
jgi:hypothetical protein